MNHKSNAILILPEFFRMLETQFQTQVKIFHSNEGGEFINTTLKYYFTSIGILSIILS
jgi:hypothetical protein